MSERRKRFVAASLLVLAVVAVGAVVGVAAAYLGGSATMWIIGGCGIFALLVVGIMNEPKVKEDVESANIDEKQYLLGSERRDELLVWAVLGAWVWGIFGSNKD